MATVPLSGTDVRLLADVPFHADYKNTRWFDTKSEQDNYFQNKRVIYSRNQCNFQRIEGSHVVAVDASIDQLWGANYLMFRNSMYNQKWFYAFITKLEYVQTKTTRVHFQIDVLQTWRFEMTFKPSFVVREHRPLWNSDGTPVVNTLDEGLNYGTDYDTVSVKRYIPNGGYRWLVIISKTPIHGDADNKVKATANGIPQPLNYYIVPYKGINTAPAAVWYKSGQADPMIPSRPLDLLPEIYTNEDAVNNVVSIYITEYPGINLKVESTSAGDVLRIDTTNNLQEVGIGKTAGQAIRCLYVQHVSNYDYLEETHYSDKYEPFPTVTESKLLMHPYSLTIIDDFKGNRMEVKNEYISGKALRTFLKGAMGVSNKVSLGVAGYNRSTNSYDRQTSNEAAMINSNPQDVAVINDYLAAFLQGNRNSIENQKASIMWNGTMGAIGSGVGMVGSALQGNAVGFAGGATNMVQGAGNTVLQIQGIEAKQQDIANVPPSMAKMGNNIAYDFGNDYSGYYIIHKMIKPEYRRKLSDFFNMFGYKANEVKIPNFHTRRYWNYIQTTNCIINGNINNEDLIELKSVFDNGITLWHTDDVGNYSLSNGVI